MCSDYSECFLCFPIVVFTVMENVLYVLRRKQFCSHTCCPVWVLSGLGYSNFCSSEGKLHSCNTFKAGQDSSLYQNNNWTRVDRLSRRLHLTTRNIQSYTTSDRNHGEGSKLLNQEALVVTRSTSPYGITLWTA